MVGNLPANKYLKDSGVKLVNQFAKLDDKISTPDEELALARKYISRHKPLTAKL